MPVETTPSSLRDLLRSRAQERPEEHAFWYMTSFYSEEGVPGPALRLGNLDRLARAIAAALAECVPAGARALLLYPPGLDFVTAFFACAYAGIIAVPLPPPDPRRARRTLARLRAVAADATPAVALTTLPVLPGLRRLLRDAPELSSLPWIATDEIDPGEADAWREPPCRDGDPAYLQYTSGSTSAPKGVRVGHANALANCEAIRRAWGYGPGSAALMWVPNFHDDGLVHGILEPVYARYPCYLMSAQSVAERPLRWLSAIGRVRATHSGGPNFAYALCHQRIPPAEREELDLASWRVAYNAAEPVQAETLAEFCRAFGPCGFRPDSFFPSYGLAEATLLVSTKAPSGEPARLAVRSDALETAGRAEPAPAAAPGSRTLVGCGAVVPGTEVVIADPRDGRRCGADEVGEVWIGGPCVAEGYWNRPEESAATFGARLADGAGPFLRTGDLGFLHAGELYITGRLKDLIIVRGRNHYPQDVELTVAQSDPELRPGCGAAFSLRIDGEERLIVVQEVRGGPGLDAEAVAEKVCRDVAEAHELQVHALVLIPAKTIPKTSSGKLQRSACRAELLAGELAEVGSWLLGRPPGQDETAGELLRRLASGSPAATAATATLPPPVAMPPGGAGAAGSAEIRRWLTRWLAARLGLAEGALDAGKPFTSLGLDSVTGTQMAAELGAWLHRPVEATLAWDYPTIGSLAAHLGGEAAAAAVPAALDDELLAILSGVETLSPEEAQEALERELSMTDKELRHG